MWAATLALGTILVTPGCGAAAGGGTPSSPSPPASPTVSIPPDAVQAVAQARADAATRTAISSGALEVVRVGPMDWPDSSLGCPKPGEFYAQIVTPGFLIQLRARDRVLEYHSGGGRTVYCRG